MMEYYDVCILCALFEEAKAFMQVLEKHGAILKEEFSQKQQRAYFSTSIPNNKGETLNILITWLARMGSMDTTIAFERILQEFAPRIAIMTGICAGNKERVKQGDLIIAEKTFLFDSGSFVRTEDGKVEQKFNIITFQMPNDILQATRFFGNWKEEAQQYPRPASKHQQKDWLLHQLLESGTTLYDIDRKTLDTNAPAWRKIVDELQKEEPPILNEDWGLSDIKKFRRMTFHLDSFPYTDPKEPEGQVGAMASGNAVRKDDPFPAISQVESKILGLDMEGTAFYYTLQEHKSIRSLVVKGVSDYGDGDKDDSYHDYAATLSAIYAYTFIKHFVTEERMPRREEQATFPATQTTQKVKIGESNTSGKSGENDKNPVKVLFCYSQSKKDEYLVTELDKHLALLKRNKRIESWDRHNIHAGGAQEKVFKEQLDEAQIIILLITPDYISSDLYLQEYDLIEKRSDQGATVIPILLRPVLDEWKEEFYGKFQALPRDGKAVDLQSNQDLALSEIASEIRNLVIPPSPKA